nr:hypothetical protein [Marinicella sp. W31]MDC2877413.1 hypothetical protein [Marinicella sp. W31]
MMALAFLFALLAIISQTGGVNTAFAQQPKYDDQQATAEELVDGIINDAADNEGLQSRYRRLVTNPISPPDTRSPRATLESFLVIMEAANELWLGVRDGFFNNDNFFMTREEKNDLVLVEELLEKAAQTLDLSGVPVASRDRTSIETVLQLQEIFDRIYLPPVDNIPGLPAGSNANSDQLGTPCPNGGSFQGQA